jgi:DNA-binding FrmR family transcriptional regulator|tara:strand:+ start:39 stop:233 length:195 start_codon:yes stop_codon:yes gene_type:complete
MKLDLNVNELGALVESLEGLEKILDENEIACDNVYKNINAVQRQEYNTACHKIYKAYNKALLLN